MLRMFLFFNLEKLYVEEIDSLLIIFRYMYILMLDICIF